MSCKQFYHFIIENENAPKAAASNTKYSNYKKANIGTSN